MRARDIKPGFFKNDQLADCSMAARLLFPGLWMMADREGRLENRPKKIKGEIFPFDDVDVASLLDELERAGLIRFYEVNGQNLIWIPQFKKHQSPDRTEKESILPRHPLDTQRSKSVQLDISSATWREIRLLVFERDGYTCQYCGKKTDSPQCDHVVPLSSGGKSTMENLVTACRECNLSKGAKTVEEWMP